MLRQLGVFESLNKLGWADLTTSRAVDAATMAAHPHFATAMVGLLSSAITVRLPRTVRPVLKTALRLAQLQGALNVRRFLIFSKMN